MKLIFTLLVVFGLAAVFVWFGVYNIAAVEPHSVAEQFLFAAVRDRSVAVRSGEIQPPPLDDPQLAKAGFAEYHSMCVTCHGAPGREASEIGQGLNPVPPKLDAEQVQDRSDAELFWIVKNGIRMTGMPAFGPTHNDETLWGIIAFVRQLPGTTTQAYRSMVETTDTPSSTTHGHSHEESGHQHAPPAKEKTSASHAHDLEPAPGHNH